MTINFSPKLQRLPRGVRAFCACVQHRAAVTKARNPGTVEQVGINAGHLGRGVGAQAQRSPGELVNQLEGLKVKRLTSSREQRLDVLKHRRHDQLVAIAAGGIQEQTP